MWRLSRSLSKSQFFRKIEQNRYCDFWSKCDSTPIPNCPKGTGDRHRRSQNGFNITCESDHVECGGECNRVYIFNSKLHRIQHCSIWKRCCMTVTKLCDTPCHTSDFVARNVAQQHCRCDISLNRLCVFMFVWLIFIFNFLTSVQQLIT